MHSAAPNPLLLPERYILPEVDFPPVLPNGDDAAWTALVLAQHQAHTDVKRQAMSHIQHLLEQFVLLRHKQFGSSSEMLSAQARLFDDVEVLAAASTEAQDVAMIPAETPAAGKPTVKARGKRTPLPTGLPRVDIVHNVPEAERTCPCGTPMVVISQQVSEKLDIVPMQIRVLRHVRNTYGCPDRVHAPVTAALPPQPLPRSNANPDFLTMLLITKYIDGLSLARFEYVLNRHGVKVPRQTLARWVIAASHLLQPLHNLMRDALFGGPFMHMDETVVRVLKPARGFP